MTIPRIALRAAAAAALAFVAASASAQARREIAGVSCTSPPPNHCPESGCTSALTGLPGNAVDAKSGRRFYLDYPCNLRARDKVVFILNLHGGGSIGNWQRHYFPVVDLKEKYKLVIATPSGTNNGWSPAQDDQHLRNIVQMVEEAVGKQNIKAFWLAGHSLGGQTSNRLINNDGFFRERLTGWVSLSGGRLGSKREDVRAPIPAAPPVAGAAGRGAAPAGRAGAPAGRGSAPAGAAPAPGRGGLAADASVLPDFTFSHIYSSGEHELTSAGLPPDSKWAQKLGCRPQQKARDIVDSKPGYVMDTREQANPNKVWGLRPRPGTAKVYLYPRCGDGHVVADIIRADKGHTEGLEPRVTEEIVKLMLSVR